MISPGVHPTKEAISLRAVSTKARAFLPSAWVELGLPKVSKTSIKTAFTSGSKEVVAALSK
jgi:hypothetical protein